MPEYNHYLDYFSGVEHSKLVSLAEKHFGGLDAEPKYKDELRTNVPYCRFTGSDVSCIAFLSHCYFTSVNWIILIVQSLYVPE